MLKNKQCNHRLKQQWSMDVKIFYMVSKYVPTSYLLITREKNGNLRPGHQLKLTPIMMGQSDIMCSPPKMANSSHPEKAWHKSKSYSWSGLLKT